MIEFNSIILVTQEIYVFLARIVCFLTFLLQVHY